MLQPEEHKLTLPGRHHQLGRQGQIPTLVERKLTFLTILQKACDLPKAPSTNHVGTAAKRYNVDTTPPAGWLFHILI